jgi:hypothetical protein
VDIKQCSRCKEELSITEFYKNNIKNRLFPYCKKCSNKAGRIYERNNKEYRNKYKRLWRVSNPEKAKAQYFRANLRVRYKEMNSKSKYYCQTYDCYFENTKTCDKRQLQKDQACKGCFGAVELDQPLNISNFNINIKICRTPGCDKEVEVKGLCKSCYQRDYMERIREKKDENIIDEIKNEVEKEAKRLIETINKEVYKEDQGGVDKELKNLELIIEGHILGWKTKLRAVQLTRKSLKDLNYDVSKEDFELLEE